MDDLNNTIMAAYRNGFGEMTPTRQFHFASRLYLWQQVPEAQAWLDELRADFTHHEQPLESLQAVANTPIKPLRQTGAIRQAYFDRYPDLLVYGRLQFRALFMYTVYGIDSREQLYQLVPAERWRQLRDQLLQDREAMQTLSSFALNYLYLYDRFMLEDDVSLPIQTFLEIGRTFESGNRLQRQLQCYYYTHAIIAESLFYARAIPEVQRGSYEAMLSAVERLISDHFSDTKLDVLYEFLVCCRLLDGSSPLEPRIEAASLDALGPDGYLLEPIVEPNQIAVNINSSEHRNVLFLLSQQPFQPLLG